MNLNKETIKQNLPAEAGLQEWNVLLAFRGSVSFNTYIPSEEPESTDDIDLLGICIPPLEYYFGMQNYGSRGTKEIVFGNLDIVVYEFHKMISMLSGFNPNVISMLWTKDDLFINKTVAGEMLLDKKDLFLSKQAYNTFGGYARGQFERMQSGGKSGYMGEKRKQRVDKYHYDTKNASHLIRLLVMCEEILLTGEVNVWREHDREKFISIKRGEWTLEEVKREAEEMFLKCDIAAEKSQLPEKSDLEAIDKLAVDIMKQHFNI